MTESKDLKIIDEEISYLLHLRKIGKEYQRSNESFEAQLKEVFNNFTQYTMNYRVLAVLIETDYCRQQLNMNQKSQYPDFLITVSTFSTAWLLSAVISQSPSAP